jgi:type VI protein secretion system component VasA
LYRHFLAISLEHDQTKYGVIKKKLQVENFSAKSVEGVQQEFFGAMYLANFVAVAAFDAQSSIAESRKDKNNKYEYKANLNELIGILKDKLILAVAEDSPAKQAKLMTEIFDEARKFVIPIRHGRSVHRNPNPRTSDFHHNQKVNC